jgi:putative heme-binding domain-containing protein
MMTARGQAPDQPPELVASTEANTPERERAMLRVPPGFVVELVASEPDIYKPMNLAFDDLGRLWVTSSIEYPYPAAESGQPRDHVTILDDFAPDGRARKITTFAEGLDIPIGVLPIADGREALVYSIPKILRLIDDDGDGRADRREPWIGTFGYRDTHGMASAFTTGFDGWVHACHGFSNDSKVEGRDGSTAVMNSGNTWRFRADGSRVEQMTWGQVNPFGLAYDARGDLYSCDCHSRPLMLLLRGGRYSSFGKPDDGLGFAPEIMTHDHGSTGISGIAVLDNESVPPSYRGNTLIGNVVTSRINRDRLEWTGSSPRAVAEPDFLVSGDPWFRPVDIEIGPDGSLYVADFYNRIIGHYEVPLTHPGRDRHRGRIWRIRYVGAGASPLPARSFGPSSTVTIEDLAADLGNPSLTVRLRATDRLAARGPTAEARRAIDEATVRLDNEPARAHALWARHRVGLFDDRAARDASYDPSPLVRVHAMRVLGERAKLSSVQQALAWSGLTDEDPFVNREAAQALARHPSIANLRPLLTARHAASADDPQLVHAIRMALRDQLRDDASWPLIDGIATTDADLAALADVAPGVPSLAAARFLMAYLEHGRDVPGPQVLRFERHIARHGDDVTDRSLFQYLSREDAKTRNDAIARSEHLRAAFRGWQERGKPLVGEPLAWADRLAGSLFADARPEAAREALTLASTVKLVSTRPMLEKIARDASRAESDRSSALEALAAIDPGGAIDTLSAVVADASAPTSLREQAASRLGQFPREQAREALLAALPTSPLRLQIVVAGALAGSKPGAEALLTALEAGKGSPRVLQDRPVRFRLFQHREVRDRDARVEALTASLPPADQAIQDLIDRRRAALASVSPSPSNIEVGRLAFEKNCAACHQLGGKGAKVGPQLDGVGVRGADRLLEDILDPNRNVDQAFRTTTIALDDGRVLSGLLLREEGEVLVLADATGKEISISRSSIDDRKMTPLSPMPANFSEQVTEQQFLQLLTYLLSCTERPSQP